MGIQRLRLRTGKFFASIALVIAWSGSLMAQADAGTANAPVGIPRELAKERAERVSDVRYKLNYTLVQKAPSAEGHEELSFRMKVSDSKAGAALLLDFREGTISGLTVNGSKTEAKIDNGHIALPASLLKSGENTVSMDFSAPIATAGKAITRFEDKDDGSEYLYTLFVPMDAEMAFPCFDQPDIKGRFSLKVSTLWTGR